MTSRNPRKAHLDYLPTWEDAMRFGLMDGRPYSEISIETYIYYARWFLERYQVISLDTLKKALLAIPTEHFAKRLKIYQTTISLAKILIQEKALDPKYLTESKKFRPRRHLPERKVTVDQKGLDKLIEACQNPLERLLVILLSQTGLRVSEAANLKLENINYEEKFLTVTLAKWGKTRRVGLSGKVIEAIHAYLTYRPEGEEEWLFINRNGNRMNRFGIRNRLDRIGERVDVKVTPHALRRAFVTLNANKGRPLVMLQIACGHNDIATTRSYCMTTEDETIEAMQAWD
ncbi:MAG: integrase family protein [Vampirovibrio sp.]|nr:integrase family protein [Vampirovibrio sp.]